MEKIIRSATWPTGQHCSTPIITNPAALKFLIAFVLQRHSFIQHKALQEEGKPSKTIPSKGICCLSFPGSLIFHFHVTPNQFGNMLSFYPPFKYKQVEMFEVSASKTFSHRPLYPHHTTMLAFPPLPLEDFNTSSTTYTRREGGRGGNPTSLALNHLFKGKQVFFPPSIVLYSHSTVKMTKKEHWLK